MFRSLGRNLLRIGLMTYIDIFIGCYNHIITQQKHSSSRSRGQLSLISRRHFEATWTPSLPQRSLATASLLMPTGVRQLRGDAAEMILATKHGEMGGVQQQVGSIYVYNYIYAMLMDMNGFD